MIKFIYRKILYFIGYDMYILIYNFLMGYNIFEFILCEYDILILYCVI